MKSIYVDKYNTEYAGMNHKPLVKFGHEMGKNREKREKLAEIGSGTGCDTKVIQNRRV
jgi:hypothetical protein